MKYLIACITLSCIALISVGCGDADYVGGTDGGNIPYPAFSSIIPLRVYNRAGYTHTLYNTQGDSVISQESMSVRINECFRLSNSTLTPFDDIDTLHDEDTIVFSFAWNGAQSGVLIGHVDMNDTTTGGIFVYGSYSDTGFSLRSTPELWLKYPANNGDTWEYKAADTTTYELINHSEPFAASPSKAVKAYLYKQTDGTKESFYYYHPDFGLLAFVEYDNGIRVRTLAQ